jgi:hypothetical protein
LWDRFRGVFGRRRKVGSSGRKGKESSEDVEIIEIRLFGDINFSVLCAILYCCWDGMAWW